MERFVVLGAMIYDLRAIPYKDSKGMNQPVRREELLVVLHVMQLKSWLI